MPNRCAPDFPQPPQPRSRDCDPWAGKTRPPPLGGAICKDPSVSSLALTVPATLGTPCGLRPLLVPGTPRIVCRSSLDISITWVAPRYPSRKTLFCSLKRNFSPSIFSSGLTSMVPLLKSNATLCTIKKGFRLRAAWHAGNNAESPSLCDLVSFHAVDVTGQQAHWQQSTGKANCSSIQNSLFQHPS